jgi:hypothetical protein
MAAQTNGLPLSSSSAETAAPQPSRARPRMSARNRALFFLTAWLLVLMPFLFWWSTWFGRPLNAKQMAEYLTDSNHPRHMQHALVQLGQRMSQHDASASQWYGDVVRLASYPREEVRSTDAWVMGQDPAGAGFHDALLKLLQDPSLIVRGNAALSLVRFGDNSGRAQIVALLQAAVVTSPGNGRIVDAAIAGTAIHQGGLVAKLQQGDQTRDIRSPITGRVQTVFAATGASVNSADRMVAVEPGEEQVWEALRALYLIGQVDDLPAIRPYERELPEISDRVRQQAASTESAIQERARK